MSAVISKRVFLAGAVARAAVGPAWAAKAASGVVVDVSPLRANGSGPLADWVAQWLPGLLARAFVGHLGGGVVHARIKTVTIDTGSPHVRWPFAFSAGATDNIDGEVWLTDAHGREIARSDLLTIAQAPADGFGDLALTQRRVHTLCENFAYWAPSRLGV